MRRVCIVQPLLATYRIPLFTELADKFQVDVLYSHDTATSGYGSPELVKHPNITWKEIRTYRPAGHRIAMFQAGIMRYMLRKRPHAVIIFANPRFLSFWTTLIWGILLGIPVFPHGHGLVKKRKANAILIGMYHIILTLSSRYICYTPSVAKSFDDFRLPSNKLAIADNVIVNPEPVHPSTKTGKEKGLLFIGRLRPGCHVDTLVEAVEELRSTTQCPELTLHVIGCGELTSTLDRLASTRPWLHVYGQVYEPKQIRDISRYCFAGVYPGNAGLSVLHMMSLSLPPITHDDMTAHEGPEPGYIQSGKNGVLFSHSGDNGALAKAIETVYNGRDLKEMQRHAFATYQNLIIPPLSERFSRIIFPSIDTSHNNQQIHDS